MKNRSTYLWMNAMKSSHFLLVGILLVCSSAFAKPRIDGEAFVGEPLGVARITIHLDTALPLPADSPFWLKSTDQRALYPVYQQTSLRTFGDASSAPSKLVAYFLFRGDDPLDVTLETDNDEYSIKLTPVKSEKREPLLDEWWTNYQSQATSIANSKAYRPAVENYLLHTLARRMGREAPRLNLRWSPSNEANQAFAVLSGAESVRIAAQSGVLLKDAEYYEIADKPLPKAAELPPVRLPEDVGADTESIAHHVPAECFYVRCKTFQDWVWLHENSTEWISKVFNLTAIRSLDYGLADRIQTRLALQEESLAGSLDDAISDIAIIGNDTFLRQGASLGILFEAKDNQRLSAVIQKERSAAVRNGARASTVEIAGRDVSLVATPSRDTHSYYAVDGDYHFVSTSKSLVKRFFEAGAGQNSLGELNEFRWARSKAPLDGKEQIFVYLSDPFFRQLISPHYRVAMTRRMRADTELELATLARWNARAEGYPGESIEELSKHGFLPPSFGERPDGGKVVFKDGVPFDTKYGERGGFEPISDEVITMVTSSEIAAYQEFSNLYRGQWRRMDPVILRIHRGEFVEDVQTVSFDLHVTPWAQSHYGILSAVLSPPDSKTWKMLPGTLLSGEINFGGSKFALGLQDVAPLSITPMFKDAGNRLFYGQSLDDLPIYAVGSPDLLQLYSDAKRDKESPQRVKVLGSSNEAWYNQIDDDRGIVASRKDVATDPATKDLQMIDTDRAAQVRLNLADLAGSQYASAINAEGYVRARKASAGNVHLMHTLMQQFHIPAEEAPAAARELLDASLVCPLGGKYELVADFSPFTRWHSTGWAHESLKYENEVPKAYRTPLLQWLAGMRLEFEIDPNVLHTHIELDLRRQ